MATSTVENYLKQVYVEQLASPNALVPMGRIAALLGVVPGTATTMVKALADAGLVDYSPRSGVQLTDAGAKLALHVLRRHRLVELFLVKVVGLDWSEVHAEAEELEHVISDKVLERIDLLLGHPTMDPHGDPIPTSAGDLPKHAHQTETLVSVAVGAVVKVVRVLDQEPAFLQFVERMHLSPGNQVRVVEREVHADAVVVEQMGGDESASGGAITLSTAVAGKFVVVCNKGAQNL